MAREGSRGFRMTTLFLFTPCLELKYSLRNAKIVHICDKSETTWVIMRVGLTVTIRSKGRQTKLEYSTHQDTAWYQ